MYHIPDHIQLLFKAEFSPIVHKFVCIEETGNTIKESTKTYVWHPGVYVWWKGNDVIKVGRHLTNSRKRAMEHYTNEGGQIRFIYDLENKEDQKKLSGPPEEFGLLLFNLIRPEDRHWAAALEIYLEDTFKPLVRSKRMG
jgi:hypothetical protein